MNDFAESTETDTRAASRDAAEVEAQAIGVSLVVVLGVVLLKDRIAPVDGTHRQPIEHGETIDQREHNASEYSEAKRHSG
jgi:hypothetical protein